AESFGGVGATWNGLIVAIAEDTQEESKRDDIGVETPEFSMPDLVDLKGTGNDYLDKLLKETRAKWFNQLGEALGKIDKKFLDALESTKRNLVKENKIAEANPKNSPKERAIAVNFW
ncbi:hypothetical protein N9Z78_03565, partial [Akkermansiaceae bacterium]|nr:hypothetical protein [Akkermansiaceae bacterium]